MTRRERHIRIVENFGLDSRWTRYAMQHLTAKRGIADLLSDEAIRELATMLVQDYARQKKFSAENYRQMAQPVA